MAQQATKKQGAAPAAASSDKKKNYKSPLKREIERVAKATGIPAKVLERRIAEKKAEIDARHKAEVDALISSVPRIIAESLQQIVAASGASANESAGS